MSDLTSAQWAQQTLHRLHEYEQRCADVELFCVGYLIPQVELLEVQLVNRTASHAQWLSWFIGFVDDSLQEDRVDEEDVGRIQHILDWLAE